MLRPRRAPVPEGSKRRFLPVSFAPGKCPGKGRAKAGASAAMTQAAEGSGMHDYHNHHVCRFSILKPYTELLGTRMMVWAVG